MERRKNVDFFLPIVISCRHCATVVQKYWMTDIDDSSVDLRSTRPRTLWEISIEKLGGQTILVFGDFFRGASGGNLQ